MFERFTEVARHVVVNTQQVARDLGHTEIASHHMLWGLARERDGMAARVLGARGLDAPKISEAIVARFGRGPEPAATGMMPFTPAAKRSLEAASEQATELGHGIVGTEHVLLGVLAVAGDGVGEVLAQAGTSAGELREDILRAFGDSGTSR